MRTAFTGLPFARVALSLSQPAAHLEQLVALAFDRITVINDNDTGNASRQSDDLFGQDHKSTDGDDDAGQPEQGIQPHGNVSPHTPGWRGQMSRWNVAGAVASKLRGARTGSGAS